MKAVLFDMDGVLIDSEKFYINGTLDWMRKYGYTGTFEDVCAVIGTTMQVTYEMIAEMLDHKLTIEEVKIINEKYFLEDHPLDYGKIGMSGAMDLMKFCKEAGLKVAVCSSSPLNTIEVAMDCCGFRPYLDFVVSGEQFEKSKPHPEIYIHASTQLGVSVQECVVIEDSQFGIEAGKSAGMTVIALEDDVIVNKQEEADYRINHLSQAKELIEKWL